MATKKSGRSSGGKGRSIGGGSRGSSSASSSRGSGSSSRSSSGGKSRSSGSSRRPGTSSGRSSSGKSSSSRSSSGGGRRGGLSGTAQKVVGSVKKHPITAAAIGAGAAIAAVAGVRKAMSARAESQTDDADDETEGSEDEESEDDEGESEDDDEEDAGAEASSEEGFEDDEDDDEDDDERSSGPWSSRLGNALSGRATSVSRAAQDGYRRGREAARETWENHALALAAGALVAGATLGLLLPSTRQESRLMGKWSDRFAGPAKNMGGQFLDQGKRIAAKVLSEGYNATQEEAEKVGLTPDRLGRKFKRIASHVRDAMAKAVDED